MTKKANLLRLASKVNRSANEWNNFYSRSNPWHYLGNFNERIRNKIIIDFVRWSKRKTMLDMACGEGTLTSALSPYFESVDAFDISSKAIEFAKNNNPAENINYFQLDLEAFDKNSRAYDFIICAEAFYYLQPQLIIKTLHKIKHILNSGGYFILTTRIVNEGAPSDPYYGFEDILEILREFFTVVTIVPVWRPSIFFYKAVKRTCNTFSPWLDNIYKGWLTSMNPKKAGMCAYLCIK
jgi:2-polyprenyl-3-methyl-5-hydroxy-6-metoxy-1,4-benzoquinol methylase